MSELTYEEWYETYRPLETTIVTEHGTTSYIKSFETYGEDLDKVLEVDPSYVWTWVDGGDYSGYSAGVHFVNRLAYFICTVPFVDDNLYVDIYEPDECEKSGHVYHKIERYDGKEYDVCDYCGEDKEDLEAYDD
jgi:hypothetical protein